MSLSQLFARFTTAFEQVVGSAMTERDVTVMRAMSLRDPSLTIDRDVNFNAVHGQIVSGVYAYDGETEDGEFRDFYVQDLYLGDDGDMYVIAVSGGRLFRFPLAFNGTDVEVSEPSEVEIQFAAVERWNPVVKRRDDGRYHGVAILSTAALNKDGEIDSTFMYDTFVERFAGDGSEYVNVYHMNYERSAVGHFDWIARDENVLIGHYVLDDTPIANRIGQTLAEDAENAWGWSIEFDPDDRNGTPVQVTPDIQVRAYDAGDFLGASIVLSDHGSAWWTGNITSRGLAMNDRQREALRALLDGDESLLTQFAEDVGVTNERVAAGIHRLTEGENAEQSDTNGDEQDEDQGNEDGGTDTEQSSDLHISESDAEALATMIIGTEAFASVSEQSNENAAAVAELRSDVTRISSALGDPGEGKTIVDTISEIGTQLRSFTKDYDESVANYDAGRPRRQVTFTRAQPGNSAADDQPERVDLGSMAGSRMKSIRAKRDKAAQQQ